MSPLRTALLALVAGRAAFSADAQPAAAAPDPAPDQDTVIVTAERRASVLERSTASVEVIEAEDLHLQGHPLNVAEAMRGLAGVDVQSAGGIDGGVSSLRLRGTSGFDTLVMVDGIPVHDLSATQSQPNLSLIDQAGLQRIELVRGGQSGLYGSGAAGGVVNLIGLRPTAVPAGYARAMGGSYGTAALDLGATGPLPGGLGYALALTGVTSDGFSAQTGADEDGDAGDHERDGIDRGGASLRLQGSPAPDATLYAAFATTLANQEYDGLAGPDDAAEEARLRSWRVSAGGDGRLGEQVEIAGDAAYTVGDRTYSYGTYDAIETYASARASWLGIDHVVLTLGSDLTHAGISTMEGGSGYDRDESLIGAWLRGLATLGRSEWSLVVRNDQHSREGDATTWRVGAAHGVADGVLRLHAAASDNFRAPSLYELYGAFVGNPEVEAQRSRGYEAGIALQAAPGLHLDSTAFRTDYQEQIVFIPDPIIPFTGAYGNLSARSRVEGVENSLAVEPPGWPVALRASYTWQRSEDQDGQPYYLLPRHKAAADLTARLGRGWVRVDVDSSGPREAGAQDLPGYAVFGAGGGWRFHRRWEAFARIDNLGDTAYVSAPGFGASGPAYTTSGRAYYAGISAEF